MTFCTVVRSVGASPGSGARGVASTGSCRSVVAEGVFAHAVADDGWPSVPPISSTTGAGARMGAEPSAPSPLPTGLGSRALPRGRGPDHACDSRLPPPARAWGGRAGRAQWRGAIVRRFGGALNLNIHIHAIVMDGHRRLGRALLSHPAARGRRCRRCADDGRGVRPGLPRAAGVGG